MNVATDAYNRAKDGARSVGDRANDLKTGLENGGAEAWEKLKDVGQDAWNELAKLDPTKLWDRVKEYIWDGVWKMISNSADRFHDGGLIPGFAGGGEVPIIAQPGEFVVNRRATQNNMGMLSAINSGKSFMQSGGGGGGIVIEKIEINARTMLDADQIRREVIPAIERDLKRKSLDGQKIIAPTGVRS